MYQLEQLVWENKTSAYEQLYQQINAILMGEHYVMANLSNIFAVLYQGLEQINWVGFYLWHNGELILGPFQGKVACMHIVKGHGVCGTAVATGQTQLVTDVHQFPGHIACDSASCSEIVIPMYYENKIIGVLDIDSPVVGRFDEIDQQGLERIVEFVQKQCDWKNFRYC